MPSSKTTLKIPGKSDLVRVLVLVSSDHAPEKVYFQSVLQQIEDLNADAVVETVVPSSGAARRKVLSSGVNLVVVVCQSGQIVTEIEDLKCDIVWDVHQVPLSIAEPETKNDSGDVSVAKRLFLRALAGATTIVGCSPTLSDQLETNFSFGLRPVNYAEAFRFLSNRVAVVIGSGLGNMMYASPMIRWLSETLDVPVDIIIHKQHGGAVELFNQSQFVHRIFPTPAHCRNQQYKFMITTASAAHLEIPVQADEHFLQHKAFDYNVEGRFVPEPEMYFLGLSQYFDDVPTRLSELPKPFLRNIAYQHGQSNVVGFANGIKTGTWAKRQWPYIADLVKFLTEQGFEMRCYGLKEEYVPGSVDCTGLSIREMIEGIAQCSYFIGHDCGTTHIAEVLGIPTTWIFGPTVAVKNGPLFAHSELITSNSEQSPNQFRLDFARSELSTCMAAHSVVSVAARFQEMVDRVERNGLDLQWRQADPSVVQQEIVSSFGPCHDDVQPEVLKERIRLYPKDIVFALKLISSLLVRRDLVGATDVARAFIHTELGTENILVGVLECLDTLHPFSTPCGSPTSKNTILHKKADLLPLFTELAVYNISENERRIILQLFVRGLLIKVGVEPAYNFLRSVEDVPAYTAGLEDNITFSQYALMHSATKLEFTNKLRKMVIDQSGEVFRSKVDEFAQSEADLAGFDKQELLDNNFRSIPDGPAPRDLIKIGLALGDRQLQIPYFANIVLITQHVDPKQRQAGSLGTLVQRHAKQLSTIGLCPIVVSLLNDSSKPRLEFRDSALYIYSGQMWAGEDWESVVSIFDPKAVLVYGAASQIIDFPESEDLPICRVSGEGLYGSSFFSSVLTPLIPYDIFPAPSRKKEYDFTVDDLTEALVQEPPAHWNDTAEVKIERHRFIVLLNNTADLDLARQMAARLPQFMFVIVTDVLDRIVMTNMECVKREDAYKLFSEDRPWKGVIELSSRKSSLSDLGIFALERRIKVVTTANVSSEFFPDLLVRPKDLRSRESWRNAVLECATEAVEAV